MQSRKDLAGSNTNAPVFDGVDYAGWKSRMEGFLMRQSWDLFEAVRVGYTRPTQTVDGETIEKPIESLNAAERDKLKANSDALYLIHSALNATEYNMIRVCKVAKEAWDILQTTYEGNFLVKENRRATLMTRWEGTRQGEDETFLDYSHRLQVLFNEAIELDIGFANGVKVK